jgi:ATP-dependent helicase/nuclease subunit B
LQAVVGAAGWARMTAAGAVYVELAESLDRPVGRHQPAPRPAPVVAPALQPTRFSFSAIATLRRDPYSIYAEHVLRLKPLDALDEEPGAAERGTLIHEALATYMREVIANGVPANSHAALIAHGRAAFEPFWYDAAVRAVWWPRFQRIAEWFVAEEKSRSALIDHSHVEIRGEITWATAQGRIVGLHGRADRIDLLRDGTVALIDYKTGAPPGRKEVQVGLAPQLTLEAAVATAGGFADIPAGTPVSALIYGRLSGVDPAGEYRLVKLENATPGEVADLHLAELKKLIDEHEAGRPFLSWAMPQTRTDWAGPYDLLARVGEWSQDGGGA